MKRMPRVLLYVFLILNMVVGCAFAGTALVNHVAATNAVLLASEAMGANRNCAINSGVATTPAFNSNGTDAGLAYIFTQNLTSSNLVRVSFANAVFTPGTVYVLGFDNATSLPVRIGQAIVGAAGANNISFQLALAANVTIQAGGAAANNYIFLTNNNQIDDQGNITGAPVVNAGAVNMTFLTSASAGATATIDVITSGGIIVDDASTVTIARAGRERTPNLTSNTLWIDYINAPFDGTLFTTASSGVVARNMATAANNAFNIAFLQKNVGIATGANAAALTARLSVNFDNTVDWQGVSRMWVGANSGAMVGGNPDCTLANNVSNVVTPVTGTDVALNVSGVTANGFNQTQLGDFNAPICIQTVGNVELHPRTISGGITVTVSGTGGVTFPATSGIFQQWVPNGFTAIVPHMRYGETTRGFIRLINNGSRTGNIIGTIIKNDGSTITGINLGTIAQNQTVNLSAQTIGVAQGLGTESDYTLSFSISVPPDTIYANAFFNLLSGGVWTTRDNTLYENWKAFIGQK